MAQYNPLDPEFMAWLIEKGVDVEKYVGHKMANMIMPEDKKNIKRMPLPKTKGSEVFRQYDERQQMGKEDNNKIINNKKKNSNTNIRRSIDIVDIQNTQKQYNPIMAENELPVKPVPRALSKIVPDYFTVKLPLRITRNFQFQKGTFDAPTSRLTLNNINSPTSDYSTYNYLGLSQWKSLFQYYRVIGSNVKVKFINFMQNPNAGDNTTEHIMKCCVEYTDAPAARLLTARQMTESKHSTAKTILPYVYGHSSVWDFNYDYNPSNFIKDFGHVSETGEEETWTPIAGAPAHPHYVHLTITEAANLLGGGAICNILAEIEIETIVQFREVVDGILTTSQTD